MTLFSQDALEGHEEIKREVRIRTFLHVFLGCPRSLDSEELPDAEAVAKFQMFVQKMNACVTHLEQFPIKVCLFEFSRLNEYEWFTMFFYQMHADMTGGASGGGPYSGGPARSAGSTLRFFKTHHLKCSLQRHPECASLKEWKGGLVKIDPLALVQAIERQVRSVGFTINQQLLGK